MRFHHVGVLVEDFEAGKTFARDVLGLGRPSAAFAADEIGLAGAFFAMGDGLLEIFTIADGRRPDGAGTIDHIAVAVDDLDAEQARLSAQGVRFTGPTTDDEITEPFELRGGRHLWTVPATSGGVRYQITQGADVAPTQTLAGKTVVVTGAGSGMGRALAQRLGRQGCPVAAFDWDADGLRETVDALDGPVLSRTLDVRDRQAQMACAAEVRAWAPAPIGAVFNNAGVTVSQTAADAAPEDDDWVMDVNYHGVVHGTRAYLPILIEQDAGTIVNTSSVFGLVGFPTQSAYCASKAAVKGYTEALRHELRGTGVGAVCVHPGGVSTNIVRNARFHVDDRGNTDRGILEGEFDTLTRTSSEKAAEIIQRGVERGRDRILVGPDAYVLAALVRLAPVRYYDVIKTLEPLIRR